MVKARMKYSSINPFRSQLRIFCCLCFFVHHSTSDKLNTSNPCIFVGYQNGKKDENCLIYIGKIFLFSYKSFNVPYSKTGHNFYDANDHTSLDFSTYHLLGSFATTPTKLVLSTNSLTKWVQPTPP